MTMRAPSSFGNLVELLNWRGAEANADSRAITYLIDGESQEATLTYRELDHRARAVGAWLQDRNAAGKRVLLLYPPGLDYVVAFWACLYARAVAVPAYPPRRQEPSGRLEAVIHDAKAEFVFANAEITKQLAALLARRSAGGGALQFIATESISLDHAAAWKMPAIEPDDLAFLQYTSGSTSTPKGVMVSHGNLITNEASIGKGFEHDTPTVVSWLPMYHDMGLIGGLLHPIYIGGHAVVMSPTAFIQRPERWLRAITKYRGHTSGGPNFAYDLCVEKITPEQRETLDLRSWSVAFNGAEPLRAQTLRRFTEAFAPCGFSASAFFPCYGLAEATLFVSGGPKSRAPSCEKFTVDGIEKHEVVPALSGEASRELVSIGPVWDQTVKIVDPETERECATNRIGEVWVNGPNVTKGYWGNAESTERTFAARTAGTGEGPFLRTGDLGFVNNGELYITGRIKDMMIIRGRNHYPQDIELTVENSHPSLRRSFCAAFSVDVEGQEQLVIVQELERANRAEFRAEEIFSAVLQAVAGEHLIQPYSIVLIDTLTLLKTSSGKIQRRANRKAYLDGKLQVLATWTAPNMPSDLTVEPVTATAAQVGALQAQPAATPSVSISEVAGFDNPLYPAPSKTTVEELILWVRDYAGSRLNSRLIDERRTIPPYVVMDIGNRGLMGMQIPAAYGGLELGCTDLLRVIRQFGGIDQSLAAFVGFSNILGNYPILRHAKQPVRERMLPLLATGRELAAFAITEPGAGSNPGAIQSRAIADGAGRYRLHGEKVWSGLASWAGVLNVFVREQDASGAAIGVSSFTVRQGTPGLRQGAEALTMGMRGMVQNTIYLEGVPVTDVQRLGEPGEGMNVAQETMMYMRLGIAAGCVGSMQRAGQLMMRYASRRDVATGRLLHNPVTRMKLSNLSAATDAVDTLVMQTAQAIDKGVSVPVDVYTACKIAGPELAWQAVDDLSQLLGGRGYIESNLIPQMLRDVRVSRVFEGPTETLRMFLGARVVNQPHDLKAFLTQHFGAEAIATKIGEAAAQIKERITASKRFGDDDASCRQWIYNLCGELATYGVLMAAAQNAHATTGKARYQRAQLWADVQFARVLREATENAREQVLLPVTELEELIGQYEESIGDVEQTLAGEQQGLDAMLRKDSAEHVHGIAEPATTQITTAQTASTVPVQQAGPVIAAPSPSDARTEEIRQWMVDWIAKAMRMHRSRVDINRPFAEYGLDSIKAIEFAQDLESWLGGGMEIEEAASWKYPTIVALAEYVHDESLSRARR